MALTMMNDGATYPAQRDGAIFNFIAKGAFVFKGIGNEFSATYSNTSLLVTVQSGMGVVCGRHVCEKKENNVNSSITLPANSTGYLTIRFNPLYDPIVRLCATASLAHGELNRITETNAGYDLPLYAYVTGTNNILSFVDLRNISKGNNFQFKWDGTNLYADYVYNGVKYHKKISTKEV